MIKLYITPSCTSCRKARAWLTENQIPFEERDIFKQPLTGTEIKNILCLTENGTEDIISIHSKVYSKLGLDFDELSFNELVQLLETYPGLLRRPILLDEHRLQIGYNAEDIHQFVPRAVRKATAQNLSKVLLSQELVHAI